jgi:hypothetical protein
MCYKNMRLFIKCVKKRYEISSKLFTACILALVGTCFIRATREAVLLCHMTFNSYIVIKIAVRIWFHYYALFIYSFFKKMRNYTHKRWRHYKMNIYLFVMCYKNMRLFIKCVKKRYEISSKLFTACILALVGTLIW